LAVEVEDMEQRKSEHEATLEKVLRLVNELGPEDQDKVAKELKLQWLRRELQKAEDQVARGETVPSEDVLAELRQRAEDRLRKSQQ
jgi:hypothetical protein